MKNFILILILFPLHYIYPQDSLLQITPEGFIVGKVITADPELDLLIALEDTSYIPDIPRRTVCKINYDFNFDGNQDIALTDHYLWGAHIGPWAIYLGLKNKKYLYIDELWFHNDAVKFDSISNGTSRVTVFDKAGGGIVDIAEYILSGDGIKEIKRTTIYPEADEIDSPYTKAYNKFHFNSLEDSCIVVTEYLKNKEVMWKKRD